MTAKMHGLIALLHTLDILACNDAFRKRLDYTTDEVPEARDALLEGRFFGLEEAVFASYHEGIRAAVNLCLRKWLRVDPTAMVTSFCGLSDDDEPELDFYLEGHHVFVPARKFFEIAPAVDEDMKKAAHYNRTYRERELFHALARRNNVS